MSTIKFDTWKNTDDTENYKVRAWASFNGSGVVAIRAAGNVGSLTDHAVGEFTVNFTAAMPDANYALLGTAQAITAVGSAGGGPHVSLSNSSAPAAGSCRIRVASNGGDGAYDIAVDSPYTHVAVVR